MLGSFLKSEHHLFQTGLLLVEMFYLLESYFKKYFYILFLASDIQSQTKF